MTARHLGEGSGARTRRPRERGAALLMAMIILTLVATLAAGMVWQQSTSVAIETAERARAQSTWILNGALDWSRIILREDARNGGADHLGEPWATPLAEARLSSFLAADKDNSGDGDLEAFLSGSIEDVQSRYNLKRLIVQGNDGAGIQAEELQTLRQLFDLIGLPPELADTIATGLRAAWNTTGGTAGDNAPLAPQTLAQLRWLGVDEASIQRMQPYVTVLPKATPINLNTAPREVIAAVVGVDLGRADRLVQRRVSNPFNNAEDAKPLLQLSPASDQLNAAKADVKSSFFEVRGRLRLGDQVQEEVALMERRDNAIVPIWRTRNQALQGP
jgi:general secretion pathway protein K